MNTVIMHHIIHFHRRHLSSLSSHAPSLSPHTFYHHHSPPSHHHHRSIPSPPHITTIPHHHHITSPSPSITSPHHHHHPIPHHHTTSPIHHLHHHPITPSLPHHHHSHHHKLSFIINTNTTILSPPSHIPPLPPTIHRYHQTKSP
eukprot:XP_011670578.1 PREDICTED: uncharacterized histidine-rich protein DDB_G0274557-like [Strongylocentrotus purpuratus]